MKNLTRNKFISGITSEKNIVSAYVVVFMLNNFTEFFLDYWLKPVYAVIYLWVLAVWLWHTFITGKYLSDWYYRMSQVFLVINLFCSFVYQANWRFSILQDFAILILYIFICFGAYHGETDTTRLDRLIICVMAVVFVTGTASLYARSFAPQWLKEITPDRFCGFYTYYNEGANYAYTSIIFFLYRIIHNRDKHTRLMSVLFILNLVIQLVYMYLTKARTYMLVLAVSVFVLGMAVLHDRLTDRKKGMWMYIMIIVIFLAAGYVLLFTKYGIARNFALYSYQGKTFADLGGMTPAERDEFLNHFSSRRYVMWKECFGVIRESPIIGYGLKSRGFTYFSTHGENAHNLFINSLLFSGVIGFAWVVVYFRRVFRDSARNCGSFDRFILWTFMLGTFLIAQLETGLLYNGKATSAICWAVMGLLTTRIREKSVKPE